MLLSHPTILISALLGLGLAIPCNTYIVIVYLEILRKKEKLSPSDVIFLNKGIVNILLQCFIILHGILFVFSTETFYIRQVYAFVNTSVYFLTYCSFWLSAWLSAHYCISITHLSYGIFIWIKGIVSKFLTQALVLTTLGSFIVSVHFSLTLDVNSSPQSYENGTETCVSRIHYIVSLSYSVPANVLGCILPFCLSLLCLVLTFSFLVRHVWRVKNNDSGSNRPNLQAHITALRTIFFLLLIFIIFCMSQFLVYFRKSSMFTDAITVVIWRLHSSFPLFEAIVIFQASNNLKRIILRIPRTRSRGNTET
ncbi:taste receptor type 2 member 39-like [Mantella aurantiaca]